MPLSEEEQRQFEQLERALAAEDPKFVSAMRGTNVRVYYKRRAVLAGVGFILGIAILMTGAILPNTIIGVIGFVVMVACLYVAALSMRRISNSADSDDSRHRPRRRRPGRARARAARAARVVRQLHGADGRPLAPPPRRRPLIATSRKPQPLSNHTRAPDRVCRARSSVAQFARSGRGGCVSRCVRRRSGAAGSGSSAAGPGRDRTGPAGPTPPRYPGSGTSATSVAAAVPAIASGAVTPVTSAERTSAASRRTSTSSRDIPA